MCCIRYIHTRVRSIQSSKYRRRHCEDGIGNFKVCGIGIGACIRKSVMYEFDFCTKDELLNTNRV